MMKALSSRLSLWLIVALLLAPISVYARQDAEINTNAVESEESQGSDDDANGEGEEVTEGEEGEEESDARFVPTEEISQDLGVAFPVDI